MELFGGGGGSALTPDGNLTLIDDYGSTTGSGKPANKCQALIFCNAANFRFILAFAQ